MSSLTVDVVLWHKADKDKTFPLYIRITEHRRPIYARFKMNNMPVSLRKADWQAKNSMVKDNHSNAGAINAAITKITADALALLANRKYSKYELKEALVQDKKQETDLIQFYEKIRDAQDKDEKGNVVFERSAFTKEDYDKKISLLTSYAGPVIHFDIITPAWIEAYIKHLKTTPIARFKKIKYRSHNTVFNHVKTLKSILAEALVEGLIDKNPFEKLKTDGFKRVKKVPQRRKQLEDYFALDLAIDSPEWHARNFYIFSLKHHGFRVSDLLKLQEQNIVSIKNPDTGVVEIRVSYTMQKTKNKKSPLLHPDTIDLLKHYLTGKPDHVIFPFLTKSDLLLDPKGLMDQIKKKTALINKNLQSGFAKCGYETKISTHLARHTYAALMSEKLTEDGSFDIDLIRQAMGHSDSKTTKGYLEEMEDYKIDSATKGVI